ncbi:MAG: hypothetical protein JNJ88_11370 [Planctomycetes bacterium]|nr:hypothetical protein [Planctomycetota bacterium]
MADQYYSFEDALKELRLKDEELKRLVSENYIRAFRDGERMKLRREDVEKLKSELAGKANTEELVFEDDGGEEPGMSTVPLDEAETIETRTKKPASSRPSATSRPASSPPAKKAAASASAKPARAARAAAPAEDEEAGDSMLDKAVLVLTFILMLVGSVVAFDAVRGEATVTKSFVSSNK